MVQNEWLDKERDIRWKGLVLKKNENKQISFLGDRGRTFEDLDTHLSGLELIVLKKRQLHSILG
jgi:hypothetical protein